MNQDDTWTGFAQLENKPLGHVVSIVKTNGNTTIPSLTVKVRHWVDFTNTYQQELVSFFKAALK